MQNHFHFLQVKAQLYIIERLYMNESSSNLSADNPHFALVVETKGGPLTYISRHFDGALRDYPTTVDLNRRADDILSQSKFQATTVLYGYQPGTYTFFYPEQSNDRCSKYVNQYSRLKSFKFIIKARETERQ